MTAWSHFRDVFLGCLDASYAADERERILAGARHALLVHVPAPGLLEPPGSGEPRSMLDAIDGRHRGVGAEDLYRLARETPPDPVDAGTIDAALSSKPLTLVVFPGIFSEMIETRPFEEIFEGSSRGRETWLSDLHRFRSTHSRDEQAQVLQDDQFDLAALTSEDPAAAMAPRPLEELIEVSSIDDEAGHALVTVVLLRPGRLSLESMDELPKLSEIAVRRLERYFRVAGTPDRVAFLGYSMGLDVALDALSRAVDGGFTWAGRVRAVVSLSGVIYGSHLADQALHGEGPQGGGLPYRQVALVREVAAALRETYGLGLLERLKVIWGNTRAWLRFTRRWSGLLDDMVREGADTNLVALLRAGKRADLPSLIGLVSGVTGAFNLLSFAQYSSNVLRFKTVVEAALAGIENLTTRARLDWWQTHRLPLAGMRLYALAGTMSESDAATPAGPLSRNSACYAADSLEYLFLCKGHRDFAASAGLSLNDSQVAVSRAIFWPGVGLPASEPKLDPDRSTFLGVLGTHHWGVVFRSVVPQDSSRSENPFPRVTLLKAVAAKIALDETAFRPTPS